MKGLSPLRDNTYATGLSGSLDYHHHFLEAHCGEANPLFGKLKYPMSS